MRRRAGILLLLTALVPGGAVELWAAADDGGEGPTPPPRVLVPDGIVVSVSSATGWGIAGGAAQVELLVPRSRLALILQAEVDGSALAVVPAGVAWAPQ